MSGQLWTEEENNIIIRAKASGLKYKEMLELLPNRALRSIAVQGAKLSENKTYSVWTQEQIISLINCRLRGLQYKDCTEIVGRSVHSLKTKGAELLKMAQEYELEEYDSAWEFLLHYYEDKL